MLILSLLRKIFGLDVEKTKVENECLASCERKRNCGMDLFSVSLRDGSGGGLNCFSLAIFDNMHIEY